MEKCYFSKKHKTGRIIGCIATLFSTIILIAIGVVNIFLVQRSEDVYACVLLCCIGLLIFLYGTLFNLYMYREYALDENGIIIRYAKRKTVFFPWKCITQICICTIHQGKVEGVKDDVIWCTVGKIKKGPPNMARRWNEAEYGMIHYHSVLTMEYTDERLDVFKKHSGQDIPDYRNKTSKTGDSSLS